MKLKKLKAHRTFKKQISNEVDYKLDRDVDDIIYLLLRRNSIWQTVGWFVPITLKETLSEDVN